MTILGAEHVTVRRGGRPILSDICFQAHAGEFIAVIGPNGAGKSTLLKVLAGLLKPDVGSVTLDARNLFHLSGAALARRRAYLPQNPLVEWPLPLERLVALGLTPHLPAVGPLPEHFHDAINSALAACDLVTQRGQAVTTLSGGEFARAMLARAIVGDPQILIVDEPIAGLDPRHAMATMQLLSQEAKRGKLVIASLHDLTLAARHATRILALVDGGMISDTESLTAELIHKVFGVASLVSGKGDSLALTLLSPSEK
ncbi:MAG: ABC transporter ATP-binding protein [Alphaproteobacteria bacterium]|nr:ABC transporter ATP-binding protein [Alphaproteobacteria bacterium]